MPLRTALMVPVLGALALAACGFPTEQHAEPIPAANLPRELQVDGPTTSAVGNDTVPVSLWFVQDGVLVAARHDVGRPASVENVTAALLEGPSNIEASQGVRSALPSSTVVDDVVAGRGLATVSLSTTFSDIPVADQVYAIGQLVLTLTDVPGIGSVQFTVNGKPIPVPLPNGETAEQLVFREQYVALRDRPLGS
jgi:spore germination protein GerM